MRIIGCDWHARQQTIAMLDTETGEVVEKTLEHEGNPVRQFYARCKPSRSVTVCAWGSRSGVKRANR